MGSHIMSVARIAEIIASSTTGFDDAVRSGVERASETLRNIESAWVKDQNVVVKNGMVVEYRVVLKVTFILAE
jgi:dodecin